MRLEQVQTIGGASGLGVDLLRFRPVSARVLSFSPLSPSSPSLADSLTAAARRASWTICGAGGDAEDLRDLPTISGALAVLTFCGAGAAWRRWVLTFGGR